MNYFMNFCSPIKNLNLILAFFMAILTFGFLAANLILSELAVCLAEGSLKFVYEQQAFYSVCVGPLDVFFSFN